MKGVGLRKQTVGIAGIVPPRVARAFVPGGRLARCERLLRNLALNGADNAVVHPVARAGRRGERDFLLHANSAP